MVVFTCNHCGDSIQKPKVAKHYQTTCSRNPIALTCVDCFKDFNLQEYVAHIKCITEDQRYSAKGTIVKSHKGDAKQSEWVETVNLIFEQQKNAKPAIRNILEAMLNHTNIPRKKAKFINFMTSAFANRFNKRDIEAVWDLLEKHKEAQRKLEEENNAKQKSNQSNGETKSEETVENGASDKTAENGTSEKTAENGTSEKKTKKKRKNKQTNGTAETEEIPEKKQKLDETNEDDTSSSKKKKKKSKQPQTEETPETNGAADTPAKTKKKKTSESNNDETNNSQLLDESQNEKFSFKQVITDILTKKSKGLSIEALQNKVLKKYEAQMGPIENKETVLKKYNKKLKALKNVTFENDKYKIVCE